MTSAQKSQLFTNNGLSPSVTCHATDDAFHVTLSLSLLDSVPIKLLTNNYLSKMLGGNVNRSFEYFVNIYWSFLEKITKVSWNWNGCNCKGMDNSFGIRFPLRGYSSSSKDLTKWCQMSVEQNICSWNYKKMKKRLFSFTQKPCT